MANGAFNYKCIAITGATSGLGRDLALNLYQLPHKPTLVVSGRRKARLDELQKKCNDGRLIPRILDQSQDANHLKTWLADLLRDHPDLDCFLFVAGIQNRLDLAHDPCDVEELRRELWINYMSITCMVSYLIPHFRSMAKRGPVMLGVVTSGLAYVPNPSMPYYSASKAALRNYVLSLRHSLEPDEIKVVEIAPPLVESELHDHQEGANEYLSKIWMPLDQFTAALMQGLHDGKDEIPVGQTAESYDITMGNTWATMEKRFGHRSK